MLNPGKEGSRLATPHHWPPELSKLVAEAVPRLNKSKRNLLNFFVACGTPTDFLRPWQNKLAANPDAVSKYAMASDLVTRINEKPDANDSIRLRREVIRRIVELRSFEQCWANDQNIARGLVAAIREIVQERDYGTRTREDIARLESLHPQGRTQEAEGKAKRAAEWDKLRSQFNGLFKKGAQPHRRGYEFQHFLNGLCAFEGIAIREAFSLGTSQQIDGAIAVDSHLYLLEARWWADPLSHKDVADFYVKISGRPVRPRGVIVSGSGFTDECVKVCQEARMAEVILATGHDLFVWFEAGRPFAQLIRRKSEYAMTEGRILVPSEEIIRKVA